MFSDVKKPLLTFVSSGKYVPSSRYRVDPIREAMGKEGWGTRAVYAYGDLDRKIPTKVGQKAYRAVSKVKRALFTVLVSRSGLSFIQRTALPWLSSPEWLLAKTGGRYIFDFDDAIFMLDSSRESGARRIAFESACKNAVHVVAGNEWLASFVPDSCSVSVVPTCLDTSKYSLRSNPPAGDIPVVGWMGTSANFKYLDYVVGALKRVRDEGYQFRFVICSNRPPEGLDSELECEYVAWSPESEVETLQCFDIGLMPLSDDAWCSGKCSFKLIQYMSVGSAVVASSVGFNRDVVADGESGFLVSNTDGDWYKAISSLIADRHLRHQFGGASRQRAIERFDIAQAVGAYRELFKRYIV